MLNGNAAATLRKHAAKAAGLFLCKHVVGSGQHLHASQPGGDFQHLPRVAPGDIAQIVAEGKVFRSPLQRRLNGKRRQRH